MLTRPAHSLDSDARGACGGRGGGGGTTLQPAGCGAPAARTACKGGAGTAMDWLRCRAAGSYPGSPVTVVLGLAWMMRCPTRTSGVTRPMGRPDYPALAPSNSAAGRGRRMMILGALIRATRGPCERQADAFPRRSASLRALTILHGAVVKHFLHPLTNSEPAARPRPWREAAAPRACSDGVAANEWRAGPPPPRQGRARCQPCTAVHGFWLHV